MRTDATHDNKFLGNAVSYGTNINRKKKKMHLVRPLLVFYRIAITFVCVSFDLKCSIVSLHF